MCKEGVQRRGDRNSLKFSLHGETVPRLPSDPVYHRNVMGEFRLEAIRTRR